VNTSKGPADFFKGGFWDLTVFQKSDEMAKLVFNLSKRFPPEEKYSLTDQCRRSSRSVGANIAEAYRKRRYPAHFVSKLSDSDTENSETQVWMKYALDCSYVQWPDIEHILILSEEVGKMLGQMMAHPEKWCTK
jgi:four helix bundle protein